MNEQPTQTQSVVVDRELPHPPEKVWRALTQGPILEEWLMKNDFAPVVDHRFTFEADWGSVEGRVLTVVTPETLAYTWVSSGLESVVTWTLSPTSTGTRLRMEQSGFRPEQKQAFKGAQYGWPKFLDALERIVVRLD